MLVLRLVLQVGLLVAVCALGGCGHRDTSPRAVEGVLDLRGDALEREGAITLTGDWEIYWERLLAPGEAGIPDGYLPIGRWNGQALVDGRRLPGMGFATYRLLVHLPEKPQPLALLVPSLVGGSRLFLTTPSGAPLAEPIVLGRVGTSPATSVGALRPPT